MEQRAAARESVEDRRPQPQAVDVAESLQAMREKQRLKVQVKQEKQKDVQKFFTTLTQAAGSQQTRVQCMACAGYSRYTISNTGSSRPLGHLLGYVYSSLEFSQMS